MKNFKVGMVFGLSLMIAGASAYADPAGKKVAHCTGIDHPITADVTLNGDGTMDCKMNGIPGLGSHTSRLRQKPGSPNTFVADDTGATITIRPESVTTYIADATLPFLFGKTVSSRCVLDAAEAKAKGVSAKNDEASKDAAPVAESQGSKDASPQPSATNDNENKDAGSKTKI